MNFTTRSYIIYFGLLIFCFLMAWWADKWNNKRYIFWIALALSIFIGFRDKSVGIDTINYYNAFKSLSSLTISNNYNDPGFYKIAYLLMKINNDPYFPILIYSSIAVFIMVYRLWDYRNMSSYKFAILRYVSLFYFYEMNCMRQFFAMSIVFFGIKYLEKKKYYIFIVFVLIASYFHIAALTSLLYLALEKFKWKNLKRKDKNLINIMYIFSPLAIYFVIKKTNNRIDPYFNNTSSLSSNFSYFMKIVLLIVFLFISNSDFKKDKYNNKSTKFVDRKMQLIYYFIGMTLTGFGFIWAQFERIGYFYYIFAPNYVGIITKNNKYRVLFAIIVILIIFRSFYFNCLLNSMGQMPYRFNWE